MGVSQALTSRAFSPQVMRQEPYERAKRVFWVADNGSSHRGRAAGRILTLPPSAGGGPPPFPPPMCSERMGGG